MVDRDVIVKSNYIIEASYRLSLGEQRVIYVLTSLINADDTEFRPYKISVKDFTKILGTKSKNMYLEVSKYVDDLRNKDLTIIKEKSVLKTKWLSSAEYFTDDGYVELCFDPKLKPYLLMLKERFTKLSLNQMVSFKSQYSGRIYELLKQYVKVRERIFTIGKLKTILEIEKDEYKLYGDFKRKVILKAVNEINKNSDLIIDFEEIKTGRKVSSIKFIIKEKIQDNKSIGSQDVEEEPNENSNQEEPTEIEKYSKVIDIIKVVCKKKISAKNAKEFYELASKHELGKENPLDFITELAKYSNTQEIGGFVGWFKHMLVSYERPSKSNKQLKFNNFDGRNHDEDYYKNLENQLLGWGE